MWAMEYSSLLLMVFFIIHSATAIPNFKFLFESIKLARMAMDKHPRNFLAPIDFMEAEFSPVDIPSVEDMEAMQQPDLFEGDILGYNSLAELPLKDDPLDILRSPFNSALNLETYPDKLWPDGIIPYELAPDLSEKERIAVAQAFEEYRNKTCIRFVPRKKYDYDYIHVTRNVNRGCSSYVGRAGGNQTVSLEIGKCFTKGIVAHELMHALGFFHEHSRPDRDQFVEIIDNNIKPGMLRNFEKYPQKIIDTMRMPYDYDSVMHYHQLAFSRNGRPTIKPIDGKAVIGQRYRLSAVDSEKVNFLYKCKKQMGAFGGKKTKPVSKWVGTTELPKVTTSLPVETSDCEDLNEHCSLWSEIGHCKWSEKYMSHYCKSSCDLCAKKLDPSPEKPECSDQNLFCGYWARIGECETESKFMKIFCQKSCDLCS